VQVDRLGHEGDGDEGVLPDQPDVVRHPQHLRRDRDHPPGRLVRRYLLEAVQRTAGIEFLESVTVTGVREPGDGQILDSTAGAVTADVIVGADGVYSVTRRFVAPEQAAASYAG
jgi:2-polyprenyl-6-methoxyphenol hydroxylase-like FAD-dependent oxidoreductase